MIRSAKYYTMLLNRQNAAREICEVEMTNARIIRGTRYIPCLVNDNVTSKFTRRVVIRRLYAGTQISNPHLCRTPIIRRQRSIIMPGSVTYRGFANTQICVTQSRNINGKDNDVFRAIMTRVIKIRIQVILQVIRDTSNVFRANDFRDDIPIFGTLPCSQAPFLKRNNVCVGRSKLRQFRRLTARMTFTFFKFKFRAIAISRDTARRTIFVHDMSTLIEVRVSRAIILRARKRKIFKRKLSLVRVSRPAERDPV